MSDNLVYVPLQLFALLYAIVIHEWAHGYAALKMGDKTAYYMGRLTLNPLKHIDPIGTVLLPAIMLIFRSPIMFGWAKPVPINPGNFNDIRKGQIVVALAGPGANLISAFFFTGCLIIMGLAVPQTMFMYEGLKAFFNFAMMINIVLFAFNLIPIPPLDGSHILAMLLPPKQAFEYNKIAPFGFVIIMGLLLMGLIDRYLIFVWNLYMYLLNLIF